MIIIIIMIILIIIIIVTTINNNILNDASVGIGHHSQSGDQGGWSDNLHIFNNILNHITAI